MNADGEKDAGKIQIQGELATVSSPPAVRSESEPSPFILSLLAVILFLVSFFLFWLANEISMAIEDEKLSRFLADSTARLIQSLLQLFAIQMIFIALSFLYKTLTSSLAKDSGDNGFVKNVIEQLQAHFNMKKSSEKNGEPSGDKHSILWVSMVLALTVNISISISNYFDQASNLQKTASEELADELKRVEKELNESITKLNSSLNEEISSTASKTESLQSQINEHRTAHIEALLAITNIAQALNQSIINFDGISIVNSSPVINDEETNTDQTVKIENRVLVEAPKNKQLVDVLSQGLKESVKQNTEVFNNLNHRVADDFCRYHIGLTSFAISIFSPDEKAARAKCRDLRKRSEKITDSIVSAP